MEHCYIIAYDLCQPERNYDRLYDEIKSFRNWGHITESVWAVTSEQDSEAIRDRLYRVIDSNDRLFVIKSGLDAAWYRTIANSEWLKQNLVK